MPEDSERENRDATTKRHTYDGSGGEGGDDGEERERAQGEDGEEDGGQGGGPTTSDDERAEDDPRHISDQSEEHNAEARGAQVELSDEEKE
jgi:hypothetical protein